MNDLHTSLFAAGLAALITLWLAQRCIAVRAREKIAHGDGGNVLLARRMRAQANFVEYTPFALAIVLALDLAGRDGWALGLGTLAFMAGRVLHAIGMDADGDAWPRAVGMALTLITLLAGALWAIAVGAGAF